MKALCYENLAKKLNSPLLQEKNLSVYSGDIL